ncbi:MAG: peptidase M6 [Candidatus Limnocylindria bacterium]
MRRLFSIFASVLLLLAMVVPASAGGPNKDVPVRHTGHDYNNGQALPLAAQADNLKGNPPLGPAKVGDSRIWLGLDDARGVINLKFYTLRGVGQKVEVWVANNLNFPNPAMLNPLTPDPTDFFTYNDCRNDGVRNVVTNAQVNYLIGQFDNNIFPIESDWFDTAPKRDGNKAILPKALPNIQGLGVNVPQSYYRGEGDNVVVLVDNVRDSNFYDMHNQNTLSYIAGFYFSVFDDFFDRTVMSIDGWDWLHRTGADPAHAPSADPCTSAPARPFLYEGVFAHEYQHLLHRYIDPDEVNWVNEGLSDFAEVLTGYVDTSKHVSEKGADSHTNSFLGWLSVAHPDWNPIPRASGPENGLTVWGDQGDDEILSDYGFAFYFMNLVDSQGYDQAFFNAWQHDPGNGIDGLNSALAAVGGADTFDSLFRDVIVSALVDGYIDNGALVSGDATAADLQNNDAEATIFYSGHANDTPGAPPWGGDFIQLGPGAGLTSVEFDGDDVFVFPSGPEWVVDGNGYWTNPDVADPAGLYANNQDLDIARSITVTGAGNLTFEHYYGMELGWDFGFVQVSTDGGSTWTSQPCTGTTLVHNPDALAHIVANVPGYTGPTDAQGLATAGTAGAPLAASCNLSAFSGGPPILLSFRLMTDPAVQLDGWHVRNLMLDGVAVDATPLDLSDWDNQAFFDPQELSFYLTLVGINGTVDGFGDVTAGTSVVVLRPTLGAGNDYTLTAGDLAALAGSAQVWAIVAGIPDAEESTLYQPYSLLLNGITEMADGG